MTLIPCDNWKTLPFIKVYHFSKVILTAMLLLSLKTVFWKKSVFYALFPQKQCDLMPKFRNKAIIYYALHIFVSNLTFVAVPNFLYKWSFFVTWFLYFKHRHMILTVILYKVRTSRTKLKSKWFTILADFINVILSFQDDIEFKT